MDVHPSLIQLPKFSPEELLGKTIVREAEDGTKMSARVTRKILDREAQDHQHIKFLLSCGDDAFEEIISYNELSQLVDEQEQHQADGQFDVWTFTEILDHEGPLTSKSPSHKGIFLQCAHQVGEMEVKHGNLSTNSRKMTLSLWQLMQGRNHLLDTPGWKFLRPTARKTTTFQLLVNSIKQSNKRRIKFDHQIPNSYQDAIRVDQENGNRLWQNAMDTEIAQLMEQNTFQDLGPFAPPPSEHQMIQCHWVFDVKADGRCKARFVAGGNLTQPPKESVYSSVVSLRSIRIVCLLAELNGLNLMSADVGNAYLEACTKEKVCFRAGPEFGPLAGHTLKIYKALYGLRSSGARFHEKFADTLRDLGFKPTFADPDVWIKDAGDVYEFVTTWVDDLLVAMKNPKTFMDALQAPPHNYKLKGVCEPKYHLGGDFFRDPDGTLCHGAPDLHQEAHQELHINLWQATTQFKIPIGQGMITQNWTLPPLAHQKKPSSSKV